MNLKQRQREALTKERQHRMATGGGPSTSGADIDPDVALIAPALMVEIPDAIDSDDIFQGIYFIIILLIMWINFIYLFFMSVHLL